MLNNFDVVPQFERFTMVLDGQTYDVQRETWGDVVYYDIRHAHNGAVPDGMSGLQYDADQLYRGVKLNRGGTLTKE